MFWLSGEDQAAYLDKKVTKYFVKVCNGDDRRQQTAITLY